MKVYELITMVDSIKGNKIPEDTKLRQINEVEARVFCEIEKNNPKDYREKVSLTDELSVPMPYSRMYLLYLCAMIAFSSGEFETYKELVFEYENVFCEYAKFFIRKR